MRPEKPTPPSSDGPLLRPHVYDGIQEFDNKLPNWWLWTFYGAIIFTFFYWFFWYDTPFLESDGQRVDRQMARLAEARLVQMGELNDDSLWEMAANSAFVEAGKDVFHGEGTCFACHGSDLNGGIGLSLVDAEWRWGNNPMSIYSVVADGSPNKASGMMAWMGNLGPQKTKQVVAYILSHHDRAAMEQATSLHPPIAH